MPAAYMENPATPPPAGTAAAAGHAPSRPRQRWTTEILSLLLSIAALAAICVLLWRVDGTSLEQWTFALSLNTVIAILSITSRSSLAYCITASLGQEKWNSARRRPIAVADFVVIDEGSRGPLGSVYLLWWSKLRYVAGRAVSSRCWRLI